ncbi:MAG: PilZ domain-containing protein [Parasulfuritortus sp.]|jgi:hypothetical protein|nr:PilZ domain-containing protein [Parasulfuritortus sp.]
MTEAGLIVDTELPFSWEYGDSGSNQEHGNRLLLRVANLLDAHDAEPSKASERIEAKLDLMLYWLGSQMFGEATSQRMTPLRLSRDLIEWNDDDAIAKDELIAMKIRIHPAIPGPLRLTGRILESDQGRIRAIPVFQDGEQEDAWDQWLFRLHRRAIQEARLKAESA